LRGRGTIGGMTRRELAREAGRLLRTTRELRGLSQARLAQRVGSSQQWLSRIERGALNPTVGDLERFFGGLGMRLRMEASPAASDGADPDLLPDLTDGDQEAMISGFRHILGRLSDVPLLVGGRLAALAHGIPVRVPRLDLILARGDLEDFAEGLRRLNVKRWSDRWQDYLDPVPADRPGPMRWQVNGVWELRVALVDERPEQVAIRLGGLELAVPPLTDLLASDPDVAELADRWRGSVGKRGGP
jgi:transcriptional regulator with XRE-family HTH domain